VLNVWLPYLRTGSGTDVYTESLADALVASGHNAVRTPFNRLWQCFPWPLRLARAPAGTEIILANSWHGFAFRRPDSKLVVIEYHCVLDPAYLPYRSPLQAVFHEGLVRGFEKASLKAADRVVAISAYTARSVRATLGGPRPEVILTGLDTAFFHPLPEPSVPGTGRPVRLLFVGNLIRRKGADLLPRIMARLGPGFELRYTLGLRSKDPYSAIPNMKPLGRLSREALRGAYREADILLFPTRFEGFGYAAAEAMACGTPVVASACASLPEIVEDGVTGRLCPVDDCEAFAAAIRMLAADPDELRAMGRRARAVAVEKFGLERWADDFAALFRDMAGQELGACLPAVP
jgi:glycosyltransferase involved in cell wall biosynthesis